MGRVVFCLWVSCSLFRPFGQKAAFLVLFALFFGGAGWALCSRGSGRAVMWLFAQAPGYHASHRLGDLSEHGMSEGERPDHAGPDHAALSRFFRHTGTPVPRSWQPSKEGAGLPHRSRTSVAQLTEDQMAADAIITYVSPTRNSRFDLRAHRRLLRSRLRRATPTVGVADPNRADANGNCWDNNGNQQTCNKGVQPAGDGGGGGKQDDGGGGGGGSGGGLRRELFRLQRDDRARVAPARGARAHRHTAAATTIAPRRLLFPSTTLLMEGWRGGRQLGWCGRRACRGRQRGWRGLCGRGCR